MERVIKFRAWDIQNGRMVYDPDRFEPSYLDSEKEISNWIFYEIWQDREDGIRRPCHIMQFTGLHDKEGKEIYEGDLIDLDGKFLYVVKYEDAKFVCYHVNNNYGKWGDLHRFFDPDFEKHHMKVVGNIYQSPKLIK